MAAKRTMSMDPPYSRIGESTHFFRVHPEAVPHRDASRPSMGVTIAITVAIPTASIDHWPVGQRSAVVE